MSRIFADNAQAIGNTPLVRINRLGPAGVTILAKIEGRNPAYSVKCRIGASMVWDAEERGVLKPGMTIVEPTSGNTGIGLAFVAAARGYKLLLTMPASMSLERRKVLKALGAELVVFPETHLTGFPSEDNIAALAEPLDGPTVSAVQRVARERNVSVAIGIAEADAGLVLDEPFDQAQLTQYLTGMLNDAQARAAWSRNGLAFAETADLYSMPQHAADVILAEPKR